MAPLEDACTLAHDDILFVSNLLEGGFFRKASILIRHLGFALAMSGNQTRKVLVRDFSNVPLWIVFPLFYSSRCNMRFLVNHNLQWTLASRVQKAVFCSLVRGGCRVLFFEQVPDEFLQEHGIASSTNRFIPHPVPKTAFIRERTGEVKVVGVIGQYRPEKGIDHLLAELEPLANDYRIVLALPNPADFMQQSAFAGKDWLQCVDTSGFEVYQKTIADCDVVVLNHPSKGYEYRASGLIADAAAAHVPVIVRDLPVLRCQINEPVCIGETFDELSFLSACIERVSKKLQDDDYDFQAYQRGRSAEVLAEYLTEIFE